MTALTLARANWRVRVARIAGAGVRSGLRAPGGTSWRRALQLVRHGYFPHADRLYDLDRHGWDAYLSDRAHMLSWAVDWPFGGLIDEKLAFFFLMRRIGAPTPEVLGVVRQGRPLALDGRGDPRWVSRELAARGALVLKPSTSRGGGRGVEIWQTADDGALVNGSPVPVDEIDARVTRLHDALICEFVPPAAYSRTIWPTPNTVRIITMTASDGRPVVAATSHRFGRARSGAVDNFSGGGIMAIVDPETGVLSRGFHIADGRQHWVDEHPDSGAPMTGVVVPGWDQLVRGMLETAAKVPFLPLIGWDVLVTDDGYRIIEANRFPATDMMQIEAPMLPRPGVREFVSESGLLPGSPAPAPTNVHVRLPGVPTETLARLRWRKKQIWLARRLVRPRPSSFPEGRRTAIRRASAGFMPSSGPLYDWGGGHGYVTDRQRELTWKINWPFAGILDDKIAFAAMLHTLDAPTPPVLAVVRAGRVLGLGDPTRSGDWCLRHLREAGRLVLRPTRSGAGMGVAILDGSGGGPRINGRECTWPEISALLAELDDFVITPFVEQAPYSRRIFPTPNTIRMLTMVDEDTREPFLAGAVHRFGAERSGPVDNWSQGGMSAAVDIEEGTLGRAATPTSGGRPEWHDEHPDSGARITGVAVPGWAAVRDAVLDLARRTAFLPYVGWDVLVTEGGHQVIEGNKMSDVQLLQVHSSLLKDDKVRAFYRAHGIL